MADHSGGYSGTPLIKKLGIKEGMALFASGSPVPYSKLVGGLPKGATLKGSLRGTLDFIHFFASSKKELLNAFPKLKKSLAQDGTLWISWPKAPSGVQTDLGEQAVRETGLAGGLVDVKVCAVDATWSGLKFVYRLKDRVRE